MSKENTISINIRTSWRHSVIERELRELDVSQQDMGRSAIYERGINLAAQQQTDWTAVQKSLQFLKKDESISAPTSFQAKVSEKTSKLIPILREEISEQLNLKRLQNQYFLLLLEANYLLALKQQQEGSAAASSSPSAADHADSAREKVDITAKRREKGFRAITWNLHSQGGIDPRDIPDWVVDEIVRSGAEISILTEFPTYLPAREKFFRSMTNQGFRVIASDNKIGNDLAIAVKSSYPILQVTWRACHGRDHIPENLQVDIAAGGKTISVLGIRIKELRGPDHEILQKKGQVDVRQAQGRLREFQAVLGWTEELDHPVLIGGDFNTYRQDTCVEQWNAHVLRELAKQGGFSDVCPEHGSSLFGESGPNEFRYDRFLTKGLSAEDISYDRRFVSHAPHIYYRGRDFFKILPGFPDHAILGAEFEPGE